VKPTVFIFGGLLLFALTRGGETADNVAHGRALRQDDAIAKRSVREERNAARQSARLSEISLERVQSGCLFAGRPNDHNNPAAGVIEGTILIEGMTATDWEGMPLADGTLVCSATNTAVIQGGVVTDVAPVSTEHRAEYLNHIGRL
jgi:hypothetical protein